MAGNFAYIFVVKEDLGIVPEDHHERGDGFYVQIKVSSMVKRSFFTKRDDFLAKKKMVHMFFTNLACSDPYLPLDTIEEIIDDAFNLGLSMVDDPQNAGRNILSMVVKIRVLLIVHLSETDKDEEEVASMMPATKSSIEALEKVTLEVNDSCLERQCAICLEMFSAGLEVTRMSCSHIYHGDCIVRWLEKSNLCPLCRLAMPVQ